MRNPFDSNAWSPSWSDTLQRSWSRVPATAGVVVSTALLAGLTYAVWRAVRHTHVARKDGRLEGPTEDVTRWEGEGGGVSMGSGRTASSDVSASPAGMEGGSLSSPGAGTSSVSNRGSHLGSSSPGNLTH